MIRPRSCKYYLLFLTITIGICGLSFQAVAGDPAREGSVRIDRLIDSAKVYVQSEPKRAIVFAEQALEQSIKINYVRGQIASYKIFGMVHHGLGQFDLAMNNYYKAISLLERPQVSQGKYDKKTISRSYESVLDIREEKFDLYYRMGLSSGAGGKYTEGEKFLEACLYDKNFGKYYGTPKMTEVKSSLAGIRRNQKKYEDAAVLYSEAMDEYAKQGNSKGAADVNNFLGELYFEQGDETKALGYFTAAQIIGKQTSYLEGLTRATDNIGKVLRRQNKLSDEIELKQNSIEFNQSLNNSKGAAKENIDLGYLYMKDNKAKEAIPYFQQGLNLSDTKGAFEEKGRAHRALTDAFLKQGNITKALESLRQYLAAIDSIQKYKEEELREMLLLSGNLVQKQKRIELLEKERELNDKTIELLRQDQLLKEQEISQRTIIIWSLGLGIVVLIAGGIAVVRGALEKRRANQLLALKSLRSQMNPHFIFNALNSVNNFISQNDERSANKYLSEFSRLMRSVMENSQHDFIPLAEEIETLRIYLALEHSRFRNKFDYHFRVDPELDSHSIDVPPMLVQPYIENAVWHGMRYLDGKGTLTVSVERIGEGIKVVVEDNGIGRAKSKELKTANQKKQSSTGMRNIENRLNIINELFRTGIKVSITDMDPSAENKGTRVEILIPQTKTS